MNYPIDKINRVEEEIRKYRESYKYRTFEYPIETLVQKYLDDEIFIPNQGAMRWTDVNQSRFVESIFLGLPIPYIFVAESQDSARLEIIDGSRRVRTLARFLGNKLLLKELGRLTELNGLIFGDLLSSRQKRFSRIPLRIIQIDADEEIRRDLFERINVIFA